MKQLYDVGYQDIRNLQLLLKAAMELDAVIWDVRFSPRSRNAEWNKKNLEVVLSGYYYHAKEFGNKNYKGGPIEFVALDAGLGMLETALEERNVILMCACWQRNQCHRTVAAKHFEDRTGMASIPLTLALTKEIVQRSEPKQLDLFTA